MTNWLYWTQVDACYGSSHVLTSCNGAKDWFNASAEPDWCHDEPTMCSLRPGALFTLQSAESDSLRWLVL